MYSYVHFLEKKDTKFTFRPIPSDVFSVRTCYNQFGHLKKEKEIQNYNKAYDENGIVNCLFSIAKICDKIADDGRN